MPVVSWRQSCSTSCMSHAPGWHNSTIMRREFPLPLPPPPALQRPPSPTTGSHMHEERVAWCRWSRRFVPSWCARCFSGRRTSCVGTHTSLESGCLCSCPALPALLPSPAQFDNKAPSLAAVLAPSVVLIALVSPRPMQGPALPLLLRPPAVWLLPQPACCLPPACWGVPTLPARRWWRVRRRRPCHHHRPCHPSESVLRPPQRLATARLKRCCPAPSVLVPALVPVPVPLPVLVLVAVAVPLPLPVLVPARAQVPGPQVSV